jgi:hypothetical protein
MTFEEWWMTLLPAEVDELKPVFELCWENARTNAIKDEREECAKICDRFAERIMHPSECAMAIRMRSIACHTIP